VHTLALQADLVLTVGDVRARIIGDGDRLTLVTADPAGLWDEAAHAELPPGASSLSRLLGQVAGALDSAGLTLDVAGDDGTVLALGRGCRSVLGRVLTGDRHLRLGSAKAVYPLVARMARTRVAARRRVVLAVPLGLGLAFLMRAVLRRNR